MIETFERPTCPACTSADVIPIVYGSPSSAAGDEQSAGRLVLGGCVITGVEPRWHCKACGNDFRKIGEELDDPPES